METLEALKARHAKEAARREAELHVAGLAPIVPDYIGLSGKRPAWIVYRGRTLTQALELAAAFADCVPLYEHRKTFCQLVPDGCADDGAEVKGGPFACYLDVSQGKGFGPSAKLTFYAGLADPVTAPQKRLVRVSIEIAGPDYLGHFSALSASRVPVATNQRGEVTEWRVGPNAALAGLSDGRVQWATGERGTAAAHISYMFAADTEESGPWSDNSHAIGQLRNLRDEFQPASHRRGNSL